MGTEARPRPSVLVVNPDPAARNRIVAVLAAQFDVTACASAAEALALLRIARRHAMVVDASLDKGGTSVELLHACVAAGIAPATVMTTARGQIQTAVEALREGFSDYVPEPYDDRLTQALLAALSSSSAAAAVALSPTAS